MLLTLQQLHLEPSLGAAPTPTGWCHERCHLLVAVFFPASLFSSVLYWGTGDDDDGMGTKVIFRLPAGGARSPGPPRTAGGRPVPPGGQHLDIMCK